jgi:hypothetical protein
MGGRKRNCGFMATSGKSADLGQVSGLIVIVSGDMNTSLLRVETAWRDY